MLVHPAQRDWKQEVATEPFACSLTHDPVYCQGLKDLEGIEVVGPLNSRCQGKHASPSNPVTRHSSYENGRSESFRGYGHDFNDPPSEDEEVNDGSCHSTNFLCQSCYERWRGSINKAKETKRKRARQDAQDLRNAKEAAPPTSPPRPAKQAKKTHVTPGPKASTTTSSSSPFSISSISSSSSISGSASSSSAAAGDAGGGGATLAEREHAHYMAIMEHLKRVKKSGNLLTACCVANNIPKSGTKADKMDRVATIIVKGNPGQCKAFKGKYPCKKMAQLHVNYGTPTTAPWGKTEAILECRQRRNEYEPCSYHRHVSGEAFFEAMGANAVVFEPAALWQGLDEQLKTRVAP